MYIVATHAGPPAPSVPERSEAVSGGVTYETGGRLQCAMSTSIVAGGETTLVAQCGPSRMGCTASYAEIEPSYVPIAPV